MNDQKVTVFRAEPFTDMGYDQGKIVYFQGSIDDLKAENLIKGRNYETIRDNDDSPIDVIRVNELELNIDPSEYAADVNITRPVWSRIVYNFFINETGKPEKPFNIYRQCAKYKSLLKKDHSGTSFVNEGEDSKGLSKIDGCILKSPENCGLWIGSRYHSFVPHLNGVTIEEAADAITKKAENMATILKNSNKNTLVRKLLAGFTGAGVGIADAAAKDKRFRFSDDTYEGVSGVLVDKFGADISTSPPFEADYIKSTTNRLLENL